MTRRTFVHAMHRAALTAAVLSVGCLSRWSGCRSYDTGRLAGQGWTAHVQCAPHTEVNLGGSSLLGGCTARWSFLVERERVTSSAELRGPPYQSRDCGDVRRQCSAAHGELSQRVTTVGTWIAGRPPTGSTRLAFVPSTCGRTYMLPEDTAPSLSPEAAVARQPDGLAYLDALIAREPMESDAWWLVCGPVLSARVPALRAAALACRTPDFVARELYRLDPASVEVLARALFMGDLPCSATTGRLLQEVAPEVLGRLLRSSLAECEVHCRPRGRVHLLREAGLMRLPEVRETALRLASAGPPSHVSIDAPVAERTRYQEAFDEWLTAQWALTQVDLQRGAEVGLATLRRLPAEEGCTRLPDGGDEPPVAIYDDPATSLCSVLVSGDTPQVREGLWQIASDESVATGVRQHALLALARLRDPRATGASLARDPLTVGQAALVAERLDGSRGGTRSTGSSHGHHHWH